jgi:hypothetical protein
MTAMAAHRATSTESSESESESESLESETLESETLESETQEEMSSYLMSDDATDDTADSIRGITPPRVVVTELESSDESETYHIDPATVYKAQYSSTRISKKTTTTKKRTMPPLDRPGPSTYPRVHVPVSVISVVVMNSRDAKYHHTTVHVYGDAASITAIHHEWHEATVHASDIPAPLADLYTLIPALWRYAPRRVRLGKNADTVPLAVWSGPDQPGDHPHALKSCYTLYIVM